MTSWSRVYHVTMGPSPRLKSIKSMVFLIITDTMMLIECKGFPSVFPLKKIAINFWCNKCAAIGALRISFFTKREGSSGAGDYSCEASNLGSYRA